MDILYLTSDEYDDHRDQYDGYCIECGEWTDGGVEPDAQRLECPECHLMAVYGIEEILMNGKIEITD